MLANKSKELNYSSDEHHTMENKYTLLIADDEVDLIEVIAYDLKPLKYHILTASDGKAALEVLCREKVDAVLSDINMPGLSGLDLLREVNQRGTSIPFIFLTGYGDKEKAVTALRLGALDFLDKPFDRDSLRNSVKKAVELGYSLRNIESESEHGYEELNLDERQKEEFKKMQKALIIMKKESTVLVKGFLMPR